MNRNLTVAVGFLTLMLLTARAAHGAAMVYTFDAPGITGGGAALTGQDNWADFNGVATVTVDTVTTPYAASTNVAGSDGYWYRVNNGNFSFAPLTASDTDTVLEYDLQAHVNNGTDTVFALGNPSAASDYGRIGPSFGFFQGQFIIRQANFSTITAAALGAGDTNTEWYRLQLHIDFTSFAGAGSGTLMVKNLSDGEASFRTVLSGVNLGITGMTADSRDPATWDTLFIHVGVGKMDNLSPNANVVVPEPASLGLLVVGGALLLGKRRKG
jgi:hypothetical protein